MRPLAFFARLLGAIRREIAEGTGHSPVDAAPQLRNYPY